MCGIVGMAGRLEYKHVSAFKDLLIVNQLRGRDATGVIRVSNSGADTWVKRVGPPEFLTETKEYDKNIDVAGAKVLIGHGRAKTLGDNIHRNAHPFDHGDIVGVHNGTLRSHYSMERAREFDVDSDLLYWHINEYGLQETISELDNSGAWALVYWNRADGTVNFIRNAERPLYFAHSEDNKVMFWASEPWYFSVLTRKGIALRKDESGSSFYPLPIETHLAFKIDAFKTEPSEIFTLRVTKDVKGAVKTTNSNFSNRGSTGSFNQPVTMGGSVPRPFVKTDELNDKVGDIGKSTLPPKLLPPTTRTPAGSTSILGLDGKPLNSSTPSTGLLTESNDGKNGQRPKLSLVSNSSKSSVPVNNENTSKKCTEIGGNFEKPKVSFRTILKREYITDNKTGREFDIDVFDQETTGHCTFCETAIGDLTDVHEIFISPKTLVYDEVITFICKSCVDPNLAIVLVGKELQKAMM